MQAYNGTRKNQPVCSAAGCLDGAVIVADNGQDAHCARHCADWEIVAAASLDAINWHLSVPTVKED